MTEYRQLLIEIARCPIALKIRTRAHEGGHPCSIIVDSQPTSSFQLPEPWSGKLDVAPVLFLSSNPSIDESERYPDLTWTEDQTNDFFHNRFGATAGWVRNGLNTLQKDGSFSRNWVRFWAAARSRAAELLEKERALITPGLDFALTEVVHCKSRNEVGVKEAQEFCSKRYLDRILSVSAAKVIVVFGQSAKDVVVNQLSRSMRPLFDGERNLFAQEQRMIVFLAHPAGFGHKKSVKDTVGDEGLRLLRNHLREHRMGALQAR